MTKYANRKRLKGPTLKGGDKVYLLRRNIKSDKPTKKLDAVKLGLFKILRQKGPVNYELELPKRMRIHLVFHVLLLEPATPDAALQQDVRDIDPEIQEPIYQVDKILTSSRTMKSESSTRVNRSQRGLGDNTSRKVGLPDVILGSGRHLQHAVESELRFRYFHTKGFLGREKCLFKSILCL
jgi:hypothetical protein